MSNRRDFIRKSMMLGAGSMLAPVSEMFGEEMLRDGDFAASGNAAPITAAKGDTYTVNMGFIRAPKRTPRQISIPDTEGYKVLKGDFHIHTLFSDGHTMPYQRVEEAVDNGLDIISITDHIEYRPYFSKGGKWKLAEGQGDDFNIWYDIGKAEADKQNLLLVRGVEITKRKMPPGHLNAFFTADNNPIAAAVDDWRKMVQIAHEQGAFVLWNHPGWEAPQSGGIEKGAPLVFHKEHEEIVQNGMLQGVEIFNHTEHYPIVSDWCNKYNLAPFANSDIHDTELRLYGIQNPLRPINLIFAKERTVESIKEAMFDKRIVAWAANTLWGSERWLKALFKAAVEIRTITPGTLALKNTSSLPVSVTLGGVVFELPKDIERQVYLAEGVKKISVVNWMPATNKPLDVEI